jgi:phage terminase large subunit-like protein
MVPQDVTPWPSLGGLVCGWIEENLVFGPGDLLGEPARLDDEKRALIWRAYEIYPKGHTFEGRRRFKRVALSLRKGSAKTEIAAWIAAVELHPEGPVRFDGWAKDGSPLGRPVKDPYIPMVAYTEEQTELLAYGALKAILEESPIAEDFDIGLERIMRRRGDGKAEALSSSPNARDGARTTFQHFDETHRFALPKLVESHRTMLANIAKRKLADGWSLETTTAPEPGGGSVAEGTMEYARAVAEGRAQPRDFFFFHRQASDEHDLTTEAGARAALLEATGPAMAEWADLEATMGLWHDPNYPLSDWERFFCNRLVKSSHKAFDPALWKGLARPDNPVRNGDLIVLGFDGAMFRDSTGLVATHVETGYQFVLGAWECPPGRDDWQVPAGEVDDAVRAAFERYDVWRMYADPPYWQSWVAQWAGEFGEDRVVEWWTNRRKPMTYALESFHTAIREGAISHDGNDALRRHIGNAFRHDLPQLDEQGKPLWLIRKERSDSPYKIDLAMAAVLSWEARTDAIAAGVNQQVSAGIEVW